MSKVALITGITGQDGSYLSELLLSKGYEVHGLSRGICENQVKKNVQIYVGDLSDEKRVHQIIQELKPDEIYNLAAQSHTGMSGDQPIYTGDVNGLGVVRILEAIRKCDKNIKFYQASTGEIFGNGANPQHENTKVSPRTPYACAKAYAHWMVKNYRRQYGIFAVNGIQYNHESPRRGETFVTRTITKGVASIYAGITDKLALGNLLAKRDWGFAPEYIEAMWAMMNLKEPSDFVIGTGELNTVKEFARVAFNYVGLNHEKFIISNKEKFRSDDFNMLQADFGKAYRAFKWSPRVKFEDLVKIMVDYDLISEKQEPPGEGIEYMVKIFPDKWWED